MNIPKVDLTNSMQKTLAGGVLLGLGIFVYKMLPSFIWFMEHLFYAGGLVAITGAIAYNYKTIWESFKLLSWEATKWAVGKNKLGYMYRYHDYLLERMAALEKNIENVSAVKIKLSRIVVSLQQSYKVNLEKAASLQSKSGPESVIKALANKANTDKLQLESLQPRVTNIEAQEKALLELLEVWTADTTALKYTLDAKAEEYQMLKEVNSATNNASEFLKGNSESYKIYNESLKQIENSVSQYTANIGLFEKKARPIIDNLSADKSIADDAGMKLLSDFMESKVDMNLLKETDKDKVKLN